MVRYDQKDFLRRTGEVTPVGSGWRVRDIQSIKRRRSRICKHTGVPYFQQHAMRHNTWIASPPAFQRDTKAFLQSKQIKALREGMTQQHRHTRRAASQNAASHGKISDDTLTLDESAHRPADRTRHRTTPSQQRWATLELQKKQDRAWADLDDEVLEQGYDFGDAFAFPRPHSGDHCDAGFDSPASMNGIDDDGFGVTAGLATSHSEEKQSYYGLDVWTSFGIDAACHGCTRDASLGDSAASHTQCNDVKIMEANRELCIQVADLQGQLMQMRNASGGLYSRVIFLESSIAEKDRLITELQGGIQKLLTSERENAISSELHGRWVNGFSYDGASFGPALGRPLPCPLFTGQTSQNGIYDGGFSSFFHLSAFEDSASTFQCGPEAFKALAEDSAPSFDQLRARIEDINDMFKEHLTEIHGKFGHITESLKGLPALLDVDAIKENLKRDVRADVRADSQCEWHARLLAVHDTLQNKVDSFPRLVQDEMEKRLIDKRFHELSYNLQKLGSELRGDLTMVRNESRKETQVALESSNTALSSHVAEQILCLGKGFTDALKPMLTYSELLKDLQHTVNDHSARFTALEEKIIASTAQSIASDVSRLRSRAPSVASQIDAGFGDYDEICLSDDEHVGYAHNHTREEDDEDPWLSYDSFKEVGGDNDEPRRNAGGPASTIPENKVPLKSENISASIEPAAEEPLCVDPRDIIDVVDLVGCSRELAVAALKQSSGTGISFITDAIHLAQDQYDYSQRLLQSVGTLTNLDVYETCLLHDKQVIAPHEPSPPGDSAESDEDMSTHKFLQKLGNEFSGKSKKIRRGGKDKKEKKEKKERKRLEKLSGCAESPSSAPSHETELCKPLGPMHSTPWLDQLNPQQKGLVASSCAASSSHLDR